MSCDTKSRIQYTLIPVSYTHLKQSQKNRNTQTCHHHTTPLSGQKIANGQLIFDIIFIFLYVHFNILQHYQLCFEYILYFKGSILSNLRQVFQTEKF